MAFGSFNAVAFNHTDISQWEQGQYFSRQTESTLKLSELRTVRLDRQEDTY